MLGDLNRCEDSRERSGNPPFLTGCIRRIYAAIFSIWANVMPPMPPLPYYGLPANHDRDVRAVVDDVTASRRYRYDRVGLQ